MIPLVVAGPGSAGVYWGFRIFLTCRLDWRRISWEWEILMTAQVEAFLDELYDSDRLSHQLVPGARAEWPGGGQAAGRHRDGVTGGQYEGASAAVGGAE